MIWQRKTIEIRRDDRPSITVSYLDNGASGRQTFLLLHGFLTFAPSWVDFAERLGGNTRCIIPDLKGYGYSTHQDANYLSCYDHAEILQKFLNELELQHCIVVAHCRAAAYVLHALDLPDTASRIRSLVFLSPCAAFSKIPDFIEWIAIYSDKNPILRFAGNETVARLLLTRCFYDARLVTRKMITDYADYLALPDAKTSLIATAKQVILPNLHRMEATLRAISVPVLLIRGNQDPLPEVGEFEFFARNIPGARQITFDNCGHVPQMEIPARTAEAVLDFLRGKTTSTDIPVHEPAEGKPARKWHNKWKFRMSRLIDRWSFNTILVFLFIKFLQILKTFGLKAEENGWRKATGIFLRNEYSKFILGTFRLRSHPPELATPDSEQNAIAVFVERFREFLKRKPDLRWSVVYSFYCLRRIQCAYADIIETVFLDDGALQSIRLHLDDRGDEFTSLSDEDREQVCQAFVEYHNQTRHLPDNTRQRRLIRKLKRKLLKNKWLSFSKRIETNLLIHRMMTASCLTVDVLPCETDPDFMRRRFATPNIKIRRHPGWGMLNITARFTADFTETDLWMQYHHVPVDGLPMQEILEELKHEWGSAGKTVFPARSEARTEIFYSGGGYFRARIFLNFKPFLSLRKHLNANYANRMHGPATIAGMIIWGMAQNEAFKDSKMLFPLDMEHVDGRDRELSLVFIRPSEFIDHQNPLEGFIRFQHEFNRRLARTRAGRSESNEILELYSMIHPLFYYIAKYLMPDALHEIVGSMGLSVLRSAEIFIAPVTDLQKNGFMAFSNMMMPRTDGTTCGAVSICGKRRQVRQYLGALDRLTRSYHTFLRLPSDPNQPTQESPL